VSAQQRLVDGSRDFYFFPFQVHPTGSAHSLLIVPVSPSDGAEMGNPEGFVSAKPDDVRFFQRKLAWYRSWLYKNARGREGNLFVKSDKSPKDLAEASAWRYQPRNATGIHYVNLNLPMGWQGCYKCRVIQESAQPFPTGSRPISGSTPK
jgi:hypothetical protein